MAVQDPERRGKKDSCLCIQISPRGQVDPRVSKFSHSGAEMRSGTRPPAASLLFAIDVNMTNKSFGRAMELSEAFLDGG